MIEDWKDAIQSWLDTGDEAYLTTEVLDIMDIKFRSVRTSNRVCIKCGVSIRNKVYKYCGWCEDGNDKDNSHTFV
jgi:hypothetical protein